MEKESTLKLIEVFTTAHGQVWQCNCSNAFFLDFQGVRTTLGVRNLLDLTRRINAINLAEMLCNPSRHADIALVMPHYTDRCFALTISEVIDLKDLLNGAKAMIQLNSMIRECFCQFA